MKLAKVVLIDDDPFIRATLSAAINSLGIEVEGETGRASEALKIVRANKPDVALVDLDLGPGPSGIDICHALRQESPKIGLILLTSYSDPRVHDPAAPLLPKGCRFISKHEITDIRKLVQEILVVKNKPLNAFNSREKVRNPLTNTQIEVLRAVAQGLSSSEIAEKRGVSVKAVESQISKIHKALGIAKSKKMNQRVQLVRAYFQLSGKKPPGV